MPLIYKQDRSEYTTAIWRVEESETTMSERLALTSLERQTLERLNDSRKLEWLSVRLLLHTLHGRSPRTPVLKDDCGKPFIEGGPYISFSHCLPLVSVAVAERPIGVDIQRRVDQVYRIRSKFCSLQELEYSQENLDVLHIIWGAKEAMYKAWGARKIDFRRHLRVECFRFDSGGGVLDCSLRKQDILWLFKANYEVWNDYFLVTAVCSYVDSVSTSDQG